MVLFLGIISWKGASYFNGGGCFSDGGGDLIFKWGGAPWGASVLMMGGGGFRKKLLDGRGCPPCPPHYGKPCWGIMHFIIQSVLLDYSFLFLILVYYIRLVYCMSNFQIVAIMLTSLVKDTFCHQLH